MQSLESVKTELEDTRYMLLCGVFRLRKACLSIQPILKPLDSFIGPQHNIINACVVRKGENAWNSLGGILESPRCTA